MSFRGGPSVMLGSVEGWRRQSRRAVPVVHRRAPSGMRPTLRAGRRSVPRSGSHRLSWPVVHAAYVTRADAVLSEPAPVEVLGVDETRRVAFGFRNATREASLISRLAISVRAFVTFSCRK